MTSPKTFLIELYREYLEEASFLYEQRRHLLSDSDVPWLRLRAFEDRLEAHLDGLMVGADLALEVCQKQSLEGDAGELHAAVRIFCRRNRPHLVLQALAPLVAKDLRKIRAVADALNHESPESWHPEFLRMISGDDLKLAVVAAIVLGFRRVKSAGSVAAGFARTPEPLLPSVIKATGRLGDLRARESLLKLLEHEDAEIAVAAALALLALGEESAAHYCRQKLPARPWAALPVGLSGGRSVVAELVARCKKNQTSPEVLIALGLLGGATAVPVLIQTLGDPDLAAAAGFALHTLTGAGLSETVFIPEKLDPKESAGEGTDTAKSGQISMRPDGKPYGSSVTRPSLNAKAWEKWWRDHGRQFNGDIRYRLGRPYSPATLVETLKAPASPHPLRRLAVEELMIRYGYDCGLETDLPVATQEKLLVKCAEWAASNQARFQAGEWYFAGRPVT